MKKQDFKVLKTKDLYPFPDNPFHVAEDETLSELAESIKEFGIVTPIITRPKEDGDGYEVIAGQRRVRASELAGINIQAGCGNICLYAFFKAVGSFSYVL